MDNQGSMRQQLHSIRRRFGAGVVGVTAGRSEPVAASISSSSGLGMPVSEMSKSTSCGGKPIPGSSASASWRSSLSAGDSWSTRRQRSKSLMHPGKRKIRKLYSMSTCRPVLKQSRRSWNNLWSALGTAPAGGQFGGCGAPDAADVSGCRVSTCSTRRKRRSRALSLISKVALFRHGAETNGVMGSCCPASARWAAPAMERMLMQLFWKIQDVDFLENLSCYNLLSAQVRLFVKACVRLRLPKSPTTRTQNQHQHTQKFTPVFGFVWLPNHWTSRTSDRSARVQRMPDYGCQILEARTERWPKGTSERETHATLSDKCCSSLGLAKKVSSTLCRYPYRTMKFWRWYVITWWTFEDVKTRCGFKIWRSEDESQDVKIRDMKMRRCDADAKI